MILATNVAHQLLEKSGLAPEELDFFLVATISPDSSMPSVAARVQGANWCSQCLLLLILLRHVVGLSLL